MTETAAGHGTTSRTGPEQGSTAAGAPPRSLVVADPDADGGAFVAWESYATEPQQTLRQALQRVRSTGRGFVWVELPDPTEDELGELTDELGLHRLAARDAMEDHYRAKLDRYGDTQFLVLRTLDYDEQRSTVHVGEIVATFLGHDFVAVVRRGPTGSLDALRSRLDRDRDLLRHGPSAVVYALCDHVITNYAATVDQLDVDADQTERWVFSPTHGGRDARYIYALKRHVRVLRRTILPLQEPMHILGEQRLTAVPEDSRIYFREMARHVDDVAGRVQGLDGMLDSVVSANQTQISLRENRNMRRFTAGATILYVPSLIAQIYGMNHKYIPAINELETYGYFVVLAGMGLVAVLIYVGFRRSGWLD